MVVVLLFMFLMVLRKNTFLPQIYKLIKLLPLKLQDKAEHLLRTFVKGLDIVKDRGVLINALIYTVLEWVILTISAYPLFLAVGVNDKSLESMILLAVFIPIIITVLPTPAFLGSVQVAAFLVLHEIMNESALVATTYGMIAWVSGIVLTFLAGSYFVFHEHISIKRVIAMEEEGEVDLDKL